MTRLNEKTGPEGISRGRVEALSDGVFAIVLTLLVLEIKVPHVTVHDSLSELAGVLWALAPKFVSWVISFITVCVIWLNHHRLFTLIGRIDNGLFWRNANLLLCIPMRELLSLQPRFHRRDGRRALGFLAHPRFRAAYDFLLLRAEAGVEDPAIAKWWTEIQALSPEQQRERVGPDGGGGGGEGDEPGPPRRRRRRRGGRRNRAPSAES